MIGLAKSGRIEDHLGDIVILKMDTIGMRARPEFRKALSTHTSTQQDWELDQLAPLAEDTFGRAFFDFMNENKLAKFKFTDAIEKEMQRRNQYAIRVAVTHDMIHVLTGFDTSYPGEMGVYAFQYGQRWSRWSWVLMLSTWLVYPFLSAGKFGALRRAHRRGVALGKAAPFLLAEDLEGRFHEPLEKVRAHYRLTLDDL